VPVGAGVPTYADMFWIGPFSNANAIRYQPGSLNSSGWTRGGVVNKAIEQIYAYTGGGTDGRTGLCGSTATNLYGVDLSGDWCSETAAYILRNGGASHPNFSSVSTVQDLENIYKSRPGGWIEHAAFDPRYANKSIEPGDYLAMIGSSGEPFTHSGVVIAVSDDLSTVWTVEGNVGNPRCVRVNERPYITGGQFAANISAIGKTNLFLPYDPVFPMTIIGAPSGYVRPDLQNVIVATAANQHVYEWALNANGNATAAYSDLTWITGAPLAAGDAWGWTRSDNQASVVYRGGDSAIYELGIVSNSWLSNSISAAAANSGSGTVPPAAGDPVGRAIGANSFVAFRTTGNQLYTFILLWGAWTGTNLHAVTGASASTNMAGDPSIYVRSDGRSAIVYRGINGHIYEFTYTGEWFAWQPPLDISAASGAPAAAGDPSAYKRPDGYNCIVYRGTDDHVKEICSATPATASSWGWFDMTASLGAPLAAGDPYGSVRSDNVATVTYRTKVSIPYGSSPVTTAYRIEQLSLGTGQWFTADVSSLFNLPPAFGDVRPFVTSSGRTSIPFFGARGNMDQLIFTGSSWSWVKL
jgi:hypothetical protein